MASPAALTMHDADGCVRAETTASVPPAVVSGSIFDEVSGLVAGVERIDAWLAVAKPGDRFIYASRSGLPRASAGAARMRALSERGLVLLIQARSSLDRDRLNYTAVRTAVPTPLQKPERQRLSAGRPVFAHDEASAIDALLPILDRFASKGRPCPTDKQLAERAGIAADAVQPTLDAMVAAHLIRIQGVRGPTNRRILILSTGAITGLSA